MSTHANDDATDGESHDESTGVATIESYETEDGTVFYDAENPLAWVETTRTLRLEDAA